MPKRTKKPPVNIPTSLHVSQLVLAETERFREEDGQKRLFVTLKGTIALNGRVVPIEVGLHDADDSIPAHRGKMYATTELNKNPKADAFFADAGNPVKQHECPACSGNRGRSGPEYDGIAAEVIAAHVRPQLTKLGFDVAHAVHNPGGWYGFDLFADDAEPSVNVVLPGKKRGSTLVVPLAYKYKFNCPVHGVIEAIEYERVEF